MVMEDLGHVGPFPFAAVGVLPDAGLSGCFVCESHPCCERLPLLRRQVAPCSETVGRIPHHFLNPVSTMDYTLFNIYSM